MASRHRIAGARVWARLDWFDVVTEIVALIVIVAAIGLSGAVAINAFALARQERPRAPRRIAAVERPAAPTRDR